MKFNIKHSSFLQNTLLVYLLLSLRIKFEINEFKSHQHKLGLMWKRHKNFQKLYQFVAVLFLRLSLNVRYRHCVSWLNRYMSKASLFINFYPAVIDRNLFLLILLIANFICVINSLSEKHSLKIKKKKNSLSNQD